MLQTTKRIGSRWRNAVSISIPFQPKLEGSKAIEDERLVGRLFGAHLLMKEQTMSAKAVGQASYCGVRDACLSRDLTQSGARHKAVEDRLEEVAPAQPVVDGEGL